MVVAWRCDEDLRDLSSLSPSELRDVRHISEIVRFLVFARSPSIATPNTRPNLKESL